MSDRTPGTLIEYILPEDNPEEDFIEFYSQFNLLLAPVAFGLSYYRNRDFKWAFIHAVLAAPYVAYVIVDAAAREEAEMLLEAGEDLRERAGEKLAEKKEQLW